MKITLVTLALAAAACADLSHLPAARLQAPGGAFRTNHATILRQEQDANDQGFRYNYETSDGTKAQQQGRVSPGATEDSGSLAVQGSYSYVGTDGQTYSVSYTADENGYRAAGAHLPTPPPIPDAIQRSLRLQGAGSHQDGGGYNY